MANTENVDGAKAQALSPEPSPEPEPRVTNDVEGGKKQREAVKKLSDYSKEVMAKKARDVKPAEVVEEEPTEVEEVEKSGWGISTGNAIAAVGVGVAMVCLYLSYYGKKERVTVPGPVTAERNLDTNTDGDLNRLLKDGAAKSKAKPAPAKKAAAEPRFRRL